MYKSGDVSVNLSVTSSSGKQQNKELPRFSFRRLLCSRPLFTRRIRAGSENTAVEENNESEAEIKPEQRASTPVGTETAECPLCRHDFPVEYFPRLMTCTHLFCYDCFQQYLRMEISESRININCPECSHPMHPNDIRTILNDTSQFEKYETFMVRRVLAAHPDTRWCPAPDCCYAVIATGFGTCPAIKCERPGCGTYFCYHCKATWHPNQTCQQARVQRSSCTESTYTVVKQCPRCQEPIIKINDGGCNQMHCTICDTQFCWLCMNEITELHYLSLSGCTLWGEKPWSRRKRILWRLGMLLGAPVGIILAVGAAVPAIVIGFPTWVGWRLYIKYKHANTCKRKFCIIAGVMAATLVSPVIALLLVAVGVPVLGLFVYGLLFVSFFQPTERGVHTSVSAERYNELNGSLTMRGPLAADYESIETPESSAQIATAKSL